MGSLLGAAQLALLTFLLFVGAASAAGAAVIPRLARNAARLPPRVAAGRLRVLATMPLLVGAALTSLAFAPSIAAWALEVEHHCESHLGHPHLCVVHLPAGAGTPLGWGIVLLAGITLIHRARPLLADLLRARSLVATLRAASIPTGRSGVRRLETLDPLCAAVGWLRPVVLASDGFQAALTAPAFEAALAHEREHARRRDSLWHAFTRAATVCLPEVVRSGLLSDLDLATERACDEAAAEVVGDRILVAEAILQAQRLGSPQPSAGCATFVPARWELRVRALLSTPPSHPTSWQRWDVLLVAPALVVLALAGPLHHAAESVLALLPH